MALDNRPRAPAEVASGYAYTAELAEVRRERVAAWGGMAEAAAWGRIAEYCRDMTLARAMDDDQFRFQRDKMRHRREVPMTNGDMDALGLHTLGDTESRTLPEAKQVILELALGYLSPMQRVCFELVVGGRLTVREVADALSTDPREVRQHIARARRRIEKEISPRIASIIRRPK